MSAIEKALLALASLGIAAASIASETVTYTYDAQGRLTKVTHNGSVNNNVVSGYCYDKADNLTNKTTTGAPQ